MRSVRSSDGATPAVQHPPATPSADADGRAMAAASPPAMAALLDPVTRYLSGQNLETSVAYLMETEVELGRRLTLPELEVIYRYESGVLRICHIEARQDPAGLGGAVSRLIRLIHAIGRAVPDVVEVRGLVPVAGRSQALNALHRRLLAVYEKQGAERVPGGDEMDDGSMARVVFRFARAPASPAATGHH